MKVIDAHCHIYPPKIAERATKGVGDFYSIPMANTNGTAERLLEVCEGTPIERNIVHSVATSAKQVQSINDFIMQTCTEHDRFIGFMTLHQDFPDPEAEINRCLAGGLRGIKLHPDSQQVEMDDARLLPIYEIAQSRNIPIIMHCGDYRYDYSHPRRMQRILHDFPQLNVDAAHFGGWSIFDLALEYLQNENCFLDLSSSMAFIGAKRTAELIRAYGADRVMFGSDYPMWSPVAELEFLQTCGLTDAELKQVCWNNADAFLGGID
jgi:hypothetical protein